MGGLDDCLKIERRQGLVGEGGLGRVPIIYLVTSSRKPQACSGWVSSSQHCCPRNELIGELPEVAGAQKLF